MSDARRPAAGRDPRWLQHNTVTNGSLFAVQDGDMHFSGPPPELPQPVREPEPGAGERTRVLMLAANPRSTARLALDEEARQITERLRLARDREAFELITCLAVRPIDLLQYLNQHSPHVVHFSGHGDSSGAMVLSGGDGTDQRVTAAGLGELFRVANDALRIVVLNACYSAVQAAEIGRHVDYVVGMAAPMIDEAATVFAASFYSALGFGRPIPQAFDQAVAVLGVHHPAGRSIPVLVARPNADPYLTVHH